MEIKRQIQFDKLTLTKIQNSIDETNKELDNKLRSIRLLAERLGDLKRDEKDYEIRIAIRSKELDKKNIF